MTWGRRRGAGRIANVPNYGALTVESADALADAGA